MATWLVKTDLDEASKLLEGLEDEKLIRQHILSGIGRAVSRNAQHHLNEYVTRRTGLMKKKMTSKYSKKEGGVVITNNATNPKDGVRYAWVLASGARIPKDFSGTRDSQFKKAKRKQSENPGVTFNIGGKWIHKDFVTIKPRDWLEEPTRKYMRTAAYNQMIEGLMKKEVIRVQKAAEKQAKAK